MLENPLKLWQMPVHPVSFVGDWHRAQPRRGLNVCLNLMKKEPGKAIVQWLRVDTTEQMTQTDGKIYSVLGLEDLTSK